MTPDPDDYLLIHIDYDPVDEVWIATSEEIEGLVLSHPCHAGLIEKIGKVVPELLEANGSTRH